MGLGKTLTMLSLILKAAEIEKVKENSNSKDTDISSVDVQQKSTYNIIYYLIIAVK